MRIEISVPSLRSYQAVLGCAAGGLLSLIACGASLAAEDASTAGLPKADGVSVHFQSTFVPQGYLPFGKGPAIPRGGMGYRPKPGR